MVDECFNLSLSLIEWNADDTDDTDIRGFEIQAILRGL